MNFYLGDSPATFLEYSAQRNRKSVTGCNADVTIRTLFHFVLSVKMTKFRLQRLKPSGVSC